MKFWGNVAAKVTGMTPEDLVRLQEAGASISQLFPHERRDGNEPILFSGEVVIFFGESGKEVNEEEARKATEVFGALGLLNDTEV